MMSSPEAQGLAADEPGRVRRDAFARPSLRSVSTWDGDPETDTPHVHAREHAIARAASGLVLALHISPLLGVAGAIAIYWSAGAGRDGLFALGIFLLLCAVAAFERLRARLIAHFELPGREAGLSQRQAHERAVLAADRLIRASLRLERSGPGGGRQWPPLSLD